MTPELSGKPVLSGKIVAGIDGSRAALAVCDAAAWASKQLDADILALHVLEKAEYPSETDLSGNLVLGAREYLLEELAELDRQRNKVALEQGKLQLKAAKERIEAAGVTRVTTKQRHDRVVDTLLDLESDIRLLIMGRQGEAHDDEVNVVGSHLENVIRVMKQPILITTREFTAPARFMLAYDGSKTAEKALERVAQSPLLAGLPCHLVMVGNETDEHRQQLANAAGKLEAAGFEVTTALRAGEVTPTLLDYKVENDIELTVMGTRGHSRLRRFFVGSTTTEFLRRTSRLTLLLR